jgi:NAD+ synthase (glutamine-hydrolysing)
MARYALAQINTTVGDLDGNARRILEALAEAEPAKPDLVLFPELTLAGYPPEDLLLKPAFLDACETAFERLVPKIRAAAVVGVPLRGDDGRPRNAAAVIRDGRVRAIYHKILLPNYAVFDEKRYFAEGRVALTLRIGTETAGLVVCEDAWEDGGPAEDEAAAGASVILCPSASPFHRGKHDTREVTFARLCRRSRTWFLYCNLVGGQDELVFDGASLVMDPGGRVVARAKAFEEDLLVFDIPAPDGAAEVPPPEDPPGRRVHAVEIPPRAERRPDSPPPRPERVPLVEQVWRALVLGLRDYVRKNGFRGVALGLSGGIDSALTAVVAAEALGAGNVLALTMPSRHTSGETRTDAGRLAEALGIRLWTLPIGRPYDAFMDELGPYLEDVERDPGKLTEQNIQARARMVYLMAASNKLGLLVLNTSNKSELAVGYGTLYGDMAGGFAAIRDVFKMQVYELSRHVNDRAGRELIPESTITRPPTAELLPGQKDTDNLPPYEALDPILALYVEQDRGCGEIVRAGHDPETVKRVIRLVDRNEFKRRQAVMGVRVTPKAFGKDRRLPVTNRFEPW